jgi:hypothetical protein
MKSQVSRRSSATSSLASSRSTSARNKY